jgi:hypothetical protein
LETSILSKLNPTEQKLLNLKTSENVKFSEMSNEQKQGLAKCLVKLCYFVGIKEPLSIENLKMLVFYLAKQHPTFTQEELEEAFFMASSGEFGELEHYQSFSPTYVSKIINAYSAKRSEASVKYYSKLEQLKAEAESQEKAKDYNPIEGCIEAVCIQYDAYLMYDEIVENEEKMPMQEVRAYLAIKMGQLLGLFNDYDAEKETAFKFFKRVFDTLPKGNAEENKTIIGKWIKSNVIENTKS